MRGESFGEREWDGRGETDSADHKCKCRCLQRETPGGNKQICLCRNQHELGTGDAWRHGNRNEARE